MKINKQMKKFLQRAIKSSSAQIYQVFFMRSIPYIIIIAHKSSIKNGEENDVLYYFWNYTPHILLRISI